MGREGNKNMDNKYLMQELKTLRDRNDISASASYGTTHVQRIVIELLDENNKILEKIYKSLEKSKDREYNDFTCEQMLEILNNKIYENFRVSDVYYILKEEEINLTIEQTRRLLMQLSRDGFISCEDLGESNVFFINGDSKLKMI